MTCLSRSSPDGPHSGPLRVKASRTAAHGLGLSLLLAVAAGALGAFACAVGRRQGHSKPRAYHGTP